MKLRLSTLFVFCLIAWQIASQEVTESFLSKGNVYVQYGKTYFYQITKLGVDTLPILSKNRQFLIYLRDQKKNGVYLSQIIRYDFSTSTEKVLVQTCEENLILSSPIAYANSYDYPFPGLGGIMDIKLSPDDKRIYFETTAWTVAYAVHYYVISTGKIHFFHSGSLNGIYPNGMLDIETTGIESDNDSTSCRYWQDWLFDTDGKRIKALGKKYY